VGGAEGGYVYDLVTIEKNKVIWVGEKVVRDGIKGPTVDIGFTKPHERNKRLIVEG
jgi:hypothetical protein